MLYNFILMDVSTHSHMPCHGEGHFNLALYNRPLGICFSLYKNLISWFKRYKLPVQCTLTKEVSYTSPGQDPLETYIIPDVYIHNPDNIHN
jgi:hypothetical protein